MLNTMMENENTSCKADLRKGIEILARLVFIFHHIIQHDEASGCTFYNEIDCPN